MFGEIKIYCILIDQVFKQSMIFFILKLIFLFIGIKIEIYVIVIIKLENNKKKLQNNKDIEDMILNDLIIFEIKFYLFVNYMYMNDIVL